MTANSLSPAFLRINYSSVYGPHVMTVPTVPLVSGVYAPSGWAFDLRGAEISVEVSEAVADFVAVIRPFWTNQVNLIDYTVFNQPEIDDLPTPVYSALIGLAGSGGGGLGWDKAVERTFTYRGDDFTLSKLVFLDAIADTFNRVVTWADASKGDVLRDYVTADATFLATRGGGRPNIQMQETTTLNEKLRRSYKMT